jgi:hypothetical protein
MVGVLFSQMQQIQAKDVFYYVGDEKIFLKERSDKIFLKLDLTVATKEKINDLKNEVESLHLITDINSEENVISPFIVIETKSGDDVPSTLYENCKANTMVLSATNVLEYENRTLQGLTDEFVVQLKSSSSYEQLEELALQNNCVIENDKEVGIDQYMLSVSKTSELNSLQTANLFYETGLFEFSEPDFVVINAFFTGISRIFDSSAELFQNTPNPFKEDVTIRYTLPFGVDRAEIQVFDLSGKRLKRYAVNRSGAVVIKGSELKAGIYFYSLIIACKTVSTKRMILIK